MIHIFLGTKAQLIKMAPIMKEMDQRGIKYNFINAGQHAVLTAELVREFGLRLPDATLGRQDRNVSSLGEALVWSLRAFATVAFNKKKVFEQVFQGETGICLIHGDTLTTLCSLVFAKRCGLKVGHVEAGLRSHDLLNPFPEEMIRLVTMRYSDLLFAPSDGAVRNLQKMGYESRMVYIGANTIVDTLREALRYRPAHGIPEDPYVVVTVHRLENIYSRARLHAVVALAERIAQDRQVFFVVHDPTRARLARYGLDARLRGHARIRVLSLQPYYFFANLLAHADFVVTDGGSVQEESYYLNVPCLIMRRRTEREEGLGENALLCGFNPAKVEEFLTTLPQRRRTNSNFDSYPSRIIVDRIAPWA